MKIVATSDYIMDLGSGPEPVKRGQEFEPRGNGIQSAEERARALLAQKVAVLPKDWPAYRDRTQKNWDAVQKMVADARRESEQAIRQRELKEQQRRMDREAAV